MANNSKKILVTGSAGLIGRALYDYLKQQGHDVTGVDNHSRFQNHEANDSLDRDLSEYLLSTINDFDIVYHMAAINGTRSFYTDPNKVLRNNVICDLDVFRFVESNTKTKLIYASSSEVVSGTQNIPTTEEVDISIKNIHNARWSYRLPKILAENYLFNSSIDFVIFRFFNVYSEHAGSGHFVKDIVDKIRTEDFTLMSPDETRSFCYVEDILEPMVAVSETETRQVFNLGSTEEITVQEAADTVADALEIQPKWKNINGVEGSAVRRCPDVSKLSSSAGKFSIRPFKEIMQDIIGKIK